MKRIKETVTEVLVIATVIAVMLILYSIPRIIKEKTLYLFGNFIAEGIFHDSLFLLLLLPCLFLHIKFLKKCILPEKLFMRYCIVL